MSSRPPTLAGCFGMYPIMSFFARRCRCHCDHLDNRPLTSGVRHVNMSYGIFFRYLGTNTPTDIHFCEAGSLHVVLVAEDVIFALDIMRPAADAKE